MSSRVIHVEIHGQRYAIKSDLEPQYIAELAGYLDEKMRATSRELASSDPLRVAVIAALNVADELFHLRQDSQGADTRLRARAAEIERLVDAVLDEARAKVVNG
jgi:cell division protein ZapA